VIVAGSFSGRRTRPGICHREFIDHCDAQTLPHEADNTLREAAAQRVARFYTCLAERLGKKAAIGIVGIDADKRIAHDIMNGDRGLFGERMALRHDGENAPAGQRFVAHGGVIDRRTHDNDLAALQQQIIQRFLDFQDVEIDHQIGKALAQMLDDAHRHELRDGGR